MAKMFYTLEETAEKLGLSDEQVKGLAAEGKLQQFRDRDKLMFKREQVDAMSANAASFSDDEDERSTGLLSVADLSSGVDEVAAGSSKKSGSAKASPSASKAAASSAAAKSSAKAPVKPPAKPAAKQESGSSMAMEGSDLDMAGLMADAGMSSSDMGASEVSSTDSSTSELDLNAEEKKTAKKKDPRQETGVSIFDADELKEEADPAAQTQITQAVDDEEELALQSIGSGSGLLDLTREADDTSLGAELLDEIGFSKEKGASSEAKAAESATGSSGVFEEAVAMEAGSASGLDNLAARTGGEQALAAVGGGAVVYEVYDGAGSGFSSGMLLGAMVSLITGSIVLMSLVRDALNPTEVPIRSQVTQWLSDGNNLLTASGGVLAGSIIFGLVGFFIGKAQSK